MFYGKREKKNRHWLFSIYRLCNARGKYLHGSLLLLIYFWSIGTKLETTEWFVVECHCNFEQTDSTQTPRDGYRHAYNYKPAQSG